jgi:hypothetical protein
MYWCRGFTLQDAIAKFMSVRPCNPRIVAIRQATADLLSGDSGLTPVRIAVSRPFLATSLQVQAFSAFLFLRSVLQSHSLAHVVARCHCWHDAVSAYCNMCK